jgi:hypothetical protein
VGLTDKRRLIADSKQSFPRRPKSNRSRHASGAAFSPGPGLKLRMLPWGTAHRASRSEVRSEQGIKSRNAQLTQNTLAQLDVNANQQGDVSCVGSLSNWYWNAVSRLPKPEMVGLPGWRICVQPLPIETPKS